MREFDAYQRTVAEKTLGDKYPYVSKAEAIKRLLDVCRDADWGWAVADLAEAAQEELDARKPIAAALYCALGLAGEAGEVANKAKKMLRDDGGELTEARKAELKKELGDVLWYAAQLSTELGLNLSDVAGANLEKLLGRIERGTLKGDGDHR